MKSAVLRMTVGAALVAAGFVGDALAAEEGMKALPTLLIKGEIVSLDTNDPSANLLTVKDRYGFETPIYLTPEAKLTKGETTVEMAQLMPGTAVEVEYNFDVNTAKRHAVSVKVAEAPKAEAPKAGAPKTEAAPATATAPTAAAPSPAPTTQPAQPEQPTQPVVTAPPTPNAAAHQATQAAPPVTQ